MHSVVQHATACASSTGYDVPHVPKAAGRELHAGRQADLRMPRQQAVPLAVVLQVASVQVAVQHGEQVLGRHAVPGLVEVDRHELLRAGLEEGVHQEHLWHCIVRSARVPAVAAL